MDILNKKNKKNVFVVYPGCTFSDISAAHAFLSQVGSCVLVSQEAGVMGAEFSYADIDPTTVASVVIPGGDAYNALQDEELHNFLKSVYQNSDAVIAAICNGVMVLGSTGLLVGQKITHAIREPHLRVPEFKELIETAKKHFEGTEYLDQDVVVSNRFLTARPWAQREFGLKLMELACDDASEVELNP